jgi:hypothetical protein
MFFKRMSGLATIAAVTVAALVAAPAPAFAALDKSVAPGGNFDLAPWTLQLPTGSPGSPTQIPGSQLKGDNGFTNSAFYTDQKDGAMTFWAPEKGVTTPNSKYARSELRQASEWSLSSNQKLAATLRVSKVTKSVAVGQIHLGSGGSSTKPLMELYYSNTGKIEVGTQISPTEGQNRHTITTVAVGKTWTYVIAITDGKLVVTVNGQSSTYSIPSSFKPYKQYFKAGSYNQSSSSSTSNGSRVHFYGLKIN